MGKCGQEEGCRPQATQATQLWLEERLWGDDDCRRVRESGTCRKRKYPS